MKSSEECRQLILNIIGLHTTLSNEEILKILTEMSSKSKKKDEIELLRTYIDEISFLNNDNYEIYQQNKNKIFSSYIKVDNKTRYSNTVISDSLSPTMEAFYFCDKSKQILSDKEAAAIKVMNMESNFEVEEEKHMKGIKNKYKEKEVVFLFNIIYTV
jgi:hypothetical protein